jgi:hypothetical protein
MGVTNRLFTPLGTIPLEHLSAGGGLYFYICVSSPDRQIAHGFDESIPILVKNFLYDLLLYVSRSQA